MTFIDDLRLARSGRTAVLHEFLTRYDPRRRSLHAFFEGHEDIAFYCGFIERRLRSGTRLVSYNCGGKRQVYELFEAVVTRYPDIREALFFVDKDVDDILGEPWPTDPRIFVTDVYSVENYLVSQVAFERLYRDSVKLRRVEFPSHKIADQFQRQLAVFHSLTIPLMAWIVVVRRSGRRPNLSDVNLGELFRFSADCSIHAKSAGRSRYMEHVTGTQGLAVQLRSLLQTARELRRMPAKRTVRGKFEAWFFVEFWKNLVGGLRALAKEVNGDVAVSVQLERSNIVQVLAGRVDAPVSLGRFLTLHLSASEAPPVAQEVSRAQARMKRGILSILRLFGLTKAN